MSNIQLSEEEIIKEINIIKETLIDVLNYDLNKYKEDIYNLDTKQVSAIFGLLDLYNEKDEKYTQYLSAYVYLVGEYQKLEKKNEELSQFNNELQFRYRIEPKIKTDNYISKDKIINKIKEYDDMIQATYNDTTYQGDIRRDTCREVKIVLEDLLKED